MSVCIVVLAYPRRTLTVASRLPSPLSAVGHALQPPIKIRRWKRGMLAVAKQGFHRAAIASEVYMCRATAGRSNAAAEGLRTLSHRRCMYAKQCG